MTDSPTYLAFDFGAGSGRALSGRLVNDRMVLKEIGRFPNRPLYLDGHPHWPLYRIFDCVKQGITAHKAKTGEAPRSMAMDSWGVDFGLIARDGALLGLPRTYRDERHLGAMETFFEKVMPARELYRKTGIQMLPFNTLFQLYRLRLDDSPLLKAADSFLMIPDLIRFLLTGRRFGEETLASTTQMLDPTTRQWEESVWSGLGIDSLRPPELVPPGRVVGELSRTLVREWRVDPLSVVAVATHDTASAVCAVPARNDAFAYISSGTWFLIGVETPRPVVTDAAFGLNFTNEAGAFGRNRLLKNMTGLWLLQELRRTHRRASAFSYADLVSMAAEASPHKVLIDPDHPLFQAPESMEGAMAAYARMSDQPLPLTVSETVRCILDSLALKAARVLQSLRTLGREIQTVHLIGGGSLNPLLCQNLASATGCHLLAGPAEATGLGNLLMQAHADGALPDFQAVREAARNSGEAQVYEPLDVARWFEARDRFERVLKTVEERQED